MPAYPKTKPVRSKTLRDAYRLLPCQWPLADGICGAVDGTVCCAHSNWSDHGKAGARKADDCYGAALCYMHHSALDQGSRMSYDQRRAGWTLAHMSSVQLLRSMNLWPADVAVPKDAP